MPYSLLFDISGIWGVGLGTRNADLNSAPGGSDNDSWVLCHDGTLRHDKKEIGKVSGLPGETINDGDILVRLYCPFVLRNLQDRHIMLHSAFFVAGYDI